MSEYTELLERQRETLAMQLEAAQAAIRSLLTIQAGIEAERAALASVVTSQRSEIDILGERAERAEAAEQALNSLLTFSPHDTTLQAVAELVGTAWRENKQAREERETMRGALRAVVAREKEARALLMDCWHQLDGDVYVLPGGEVHPGAVTTIHALHAFLWPEGKTI